MPSIQNIFNTDYHRHKFDINIKDILQEQPIKIQIIHNKNSQTSKIFDFQQFKKWSLNQTDRVARISQMDCNPSLIKLTLKQHHKKSWKHSQKSELTFREELDKAKPNNPQKKFQKYQISTKNNRKHKQELLNNFSFIQKNQQQTQLFVHPKKKDKFQVKIINNKLFFPHLNENSLKYLVIQGFKYPVNQNCEIKIGRNTFIGSEIFKKNHEKIFEREKLLKFIKNDLGNDQTEQFNSISIRLDDKSSTKICKYCLLTQEQFQKASRTSIGSEKIILQYDHLMISPCNCKGSCSSVHIECLKKWIKSKLIPETKQQMDCFNFTKLYCEICQVQIITIVSIQVLDQQAKLKNSEKTHRRTQKIISTPRVNKIKKIDFLEDILLDDMTKQIHPFILLKPVLESNVEKFQLIKIRFSPEVSKIKFGRSSEFTTNFAPLNDVSTSRQHFSLEYDEQKQTVYIKDLGSKYGTLVRLDKQKDKEQLNLNNFEGSINEIKLLIDGSIVRVNLNKCKE